MIGWLPLKWRDLDATAHAVRVAGEVNSLPNCLLAVFSVNYRNMLVRRAFGIKRPR